MGIGTINLKKGQENIDMDIYQHFRKSEHPFIDQVIGWGEHVEHSYRPKLTDFLNPREQRLMGMVLAGHDVQLISNGGHPDTERRRVILAPMYETIHDDDFDLVLLEATFHEKFVRLEHRDVLGAFLHQGIKRSKLGNIYIEQGIVQIIVTADTAQYVQLNLTQIKQASISFRKRPLQDIKVKHDDWISTEKTVSSLRLDVIIREIYHLSRKDAQMLITKGLVKVNYKVVDEAKFTLQVDDLISVRGKGRSKFAQMNGMTKKNKYKIVTSILK